MKSPVTLSDLSRAYATLSTQLYARDDDELQVNGARVGLASLSSAELESLARIQARFSSPSSASDLLRLPRIAEMTVREISGALARIAAMNESSAGETEVCDAREQRMRSMVANLAGTMASVPRKPRRPV